MPHPDLERKFRKDSFLSTTRLSNESVSHLAFRTLLVLPFIEIFIIYGTLDKDAGLTHAYILLHPETPFK